MRKQGVNHILQIFFPKVCPICTEVLDREQEICQGCRKKLKYITEPKCKKCGKPFESVDAQSQIRQYCGDCQKNRHDYEYGMAVFRYNDEIRESIYRFKYKNQRTYASFYADEMWKVYGRQIRAEGIEVMIPVPVSRKKMQKRGYNQAALIARQLAEKTGIPADLHSLARIRDTIPQKELNHQERRKNLNNAFKMDQNAVKYKKVLLVDDIYTTGSTIDACAVALKETGVQQVYFISLSIGAGI